MSTTGGTIDVESTGGTIEMTDGVVSRTNGGNIRYRASGDVTVGMLDARTTADRTAGVLLNQASWGAVSIVSGAAILDTAEATVDVYANEVRLNATTAIGAGMNHLEIEAAKASAVAGAGGLFVTEATDITIGQTQPVTVNRVKTDAAVISSTVTDGAQSHLTSGGALVLQTVDGSIETLAAQGLITASGNVLVQAGGATADITLGANLRSSGGNISLNAGQDIEQNADISTDAGQMTIDLLAGRDITMADDTETITSTNGNIQLEAGNNVTLEYIRAGIYAEPFLSNLGGIRIEATNGNILDGDAVGDTQEDLIAEELVLLAGTVSVNLQTTWKQRLFI